MGSCTPDKNGKLKTDKKRAQTSPFFTSVSLPFFCQRSSFFVNITLFFTSVRFFVNTRLPHVFYQCQVDKNSTSSCFLPVLLFSFLSTFDFLLYYFHKCSNYLWCFCPLDKIHTGKREVQTQRKLITVPVWFLSLDKIYTDLKLTKKWSLTKNGRIHLIKNAKLYTR